MAEDEPANKRRRLQNACDECRKKKIRCDSATASENICSNCRSSNIECVHLLEKKKRGPGPARKANNARALVNAILSTSKRFVIPDDPESVRQILVDLANYARSLDRQISLAKETFGGLDASSMSATTAAPSLRGTPEVEEDGEVEDSIEQLTTELRKVALSHEKRHIGKSSYYMLVQSVMDARRGTSGDRAFITAVFQNHQRPEFWKPLPWQQTLRIKVAPFVFPEDDLFHDLINLYFTRHHPFFPLLHRPTFERLIAEGLHLRDRSFGATVLTVCAIASRQSNDPRAFWHGTTSEHSLGWKYFQQVPLIRDSFTEPPTLYDIQLCSLAVYFLQTAPTPEAAWTIVGVGIRSAQEMGLHRKDAKSEKTVEDELWRRAFWILVMMDVFLSTSLGRPRATTPDDFDCELPSECDDEYWETSDPGQAFVQPAGKPSILSYFVTFLKLLDIIGFAQRTLYPFRKSQLWSGMEISGIEWKRKAVIELDSALNKFMDEIPDHLKWDPKMSNPVFFQQSSMLYCTYHWVQVQVHRPFIPRPGQDPILPFPSMAICSNATRKTIHILQTLQTRLDRGMIALETGSNLMISLFVSALILLVGIWRQQRTEFGPESKQDLRDVYRCIELIQRYEPRYQVAGRLVDVLTAVITIGQLPRAQESLKRPRSPDSDEHRTTTPGPGLFDSQIVPEDLRGSSYAEGRSHASTWSNPLNQPGPLPFQSPVPLSSSTLYPASVLLTMEAQDVDYSGSSSSARVPTSVGAGAENLAIASDYILQQPDPTWYTPAIGNADITQEDWNSFMSNVDDIVNGTVDYRWL
ncbi:Gypsy retrotransposon integrase-like protein 1 [Marasmius sp. AFHP31]|nr:Gypsy retrotransposon integrase-like protein 1 [Marasmius sp. AFHP31]